MREYPRTRSILQLPRSFLMILQGSCSYVEIMVRRFTIRTDFRSETRQLFINCTIGLSANVIVSVMRKSHEEEFLSTRTRTEIASKKLIKSGCTRFLERLPRLNPFRFFRH